jgi:hypothetical protein
MTVWNCVAFVAIAALGGVVLNIRVQAWIAAITGLGVIALLVIMVFYAEANYYERRAPSIFPWRFVVTVVAIVGIGVFAGRRLVSLMHWQAAEVDDE